MGIQEKIEKYMNNSLSEREYNDKEMEKLIKTLYDKAKETKDSTKSFAIRSMATALEDALKKGDEEQIKRALFELPQALK